MLLHTWTRLRVAGPRAFGTIAVLAAVLGRGVVAFARVATATTGLGTLVTPFGPMAVHHTAVGGESAPGGPRGRLVAGVGEAQGVDTAKAAG